METRETTEYKIFYLALAHVKSNVDNAQPVVAFTEYDALISWLEAQKENWIDENGGSDSFGSTHNYSKSFKKGSIIEWYNPPNDLIPTEHPSCFGGVGYIWSKTPTQDAISIPLNPSN